MKAKKFKHLGIYSDLITAAHASHAVAPLAKPGRQTQARIRAALAFDPASQKPGKVKIEQRWEKEGVAGELVTWSVGYGPRTEAYLLKPASAGANFRGPGVVALHDHGGFKFYGKEKIADGPKSPNATQRRFRAMCYEGKAFANELARRGFVVLVPDVFLWGSRRFAFNTITDWDHLIAPAFKGMEGWSQDPEEIQQYNAAAVNHENTVTKYLNALGTTLPGVIAYEDRVAAEYLVSRDEVYAGGVGCVGLSGGGMRSMLMQGTCKRVRAAVVVGAMSTYEGLFDHNIVSHTWMIYASELARVCDWSDVASCRAPSPLMVQYDDEDNLFTPAGMKAAGRRIAAAYRRVGKPANYIGKFYPGPHKFDARMQDDAFTWLEKHLAR